MKSIFLLIKNNTFFYLIIDKLHKMLSVLYCTLLNQAQTDSDKQKIMKQMEGDGELLKILRKLQETDKEDIVTEERQRRQAARKSRVETDLDTMDVDDAGVSFLSTTLLLAVNSSFVMQVFLCY